ncbi:MAG: sigma-70 family RNA polymerase sigma factor [Gemmatimonadota bacterium]|nr:sigma-70 family RNA polymerase sigma factor [Gemmatimonadota bacterium]
MTDRPPSEAPTTGHAITHALHQVSEGDAEAQDRLWRLTYDELYRLASRLMSHERVGHTLSPADLIGELWLKLVDQDRINWRDRAHFYGVAARACRRILIDHARRHRAQKRGSGAARVTIDRIQIQTDDGAEDLVALDQALARLREMDDRLYQVVELRYFGDLSEEETAQMLEISTRTVRRDLVKAKGWLYTQLSATAPPDDGSDPTPT